MNLKDKYIKLICDRTLISKDDLTAPETQIINIGLELFEEKMEDIKLLKDEIYALKIELKNLRSSLDDKEY